MRLIHIFFLAGIFLSSGCQTTNDTLNGSVTSSALSGPAASAIAGDIAGRFAEQAGSSTTPIRLPKDGSEFAVALEAALRGWGFDVVSKDHPQHVKPGQRPMELAYSLTDVDGQMLVRLSTATLEIGRAYTVTGAGATPSSPLSLMKRNREEA